MNHRTWFRLKETLLELAHKDLPGDGVNEDIRARVGKVSLWGHTERDPASLREEKDERKNS
jgi:hypothetical protein